MPINVKIVDIKHREPELSKLSKSNFDRGYFRFRKKSVFGVILSSLLLTLVSLPLIFAFEAHVINVTAQIEPCQDFETKSHGFWKNHEDLWILPQTVGPEYVDSEEEAEDILDYGGSDRAKKLARELLALKFNIAHFDLGGAFVPGEDPPAGGRINDLAWEADQLLVAYANDPDSVSKHELEEMKDRVEKVNTAKKVSACKEPPEECPKDDRRDKPEEPDFPDFPEFPDFPAKYKNYESGIMNQESESGETVVEANPEPKIIVEEEAVAEEPVEAPAEEPEPAQDTGEPVQDEPGESLEGN